MMRLLSSLGGLGLLAGMSLAQAPLGTDFAADRASARTELVTASVLPLPPRALAPELPTRPAVTPDQLLRMTEPELVQLYKCSGPAPVPTTYTPGLMIYKPGSCITIPFARVIGCTAWQGKYFPCDGTMVNRQFGVPAIKATISYGESWLDGGPSTIFDYADTSLLWKRYRDEVREVSSGVCLGIMYRRGHCGPKIATWFALDARTGDACCIQGK